MADDGWIALAGIASGQDAPGTCDAETGRVAAAADSPWPPVAFDGGTDSGDARLDAAAQQLEWATRRLDEVSTRLHDLAQRQAQPTPTRATPGGGRAGVVR